MYLQDRIAIPSCLFFKLAEITLLTAREATVDCLMNLAEDPQTDRVFSHTLVDDLKEAQQQDPLTHNELPNLFSRQDDLIYYEGTRLYMPNQVPLKL